MLIALRTDKDFDGVRAFVDSQGYGGFAVRECARDNEHWHWLLECPAVTKITAFRVQLTRKVGALKGNGAYSASEVKDLEKYEHYLAKGESEGAGPEVVWRQSLKYTDEYIEQLHGSYWEENRRLKKRKAGTAMDSTIDECKRENIRWDDREKIAEILIREIVKRGRPVNTFAARATVNSIQVQLCPDDTALKRLAEQV